MEVGGKATLMEFQALAHVVDDWLGKNMNSKMWALGWDQDLPGTIITDIKLKPPLVNFKREKKVLLWGFLECSLRIQSHLLNPLISTNLRTIDSENESSTFTVNWREEIWTSSKKTNDIPTVYLRIWDVFIYFKHGSMISAVQKFWRYDCWEIASMAKDGSHTLKDITTIWSLLLLWKNGLFTASLGLRETFSIRSSYLLTTYRWEQALFSFEKQNGNGLSDRPVWPSLPV